MQSKKKDYYEIDGYKYHECFPKEWAFDHKPYPDLTESDSGPEKCGNCRVYGSINEVFVCYCTLCSENIYKGERPGTSSSITTDEQLWKIAPYMVGISISEIGEKLDEAAIKAKKRAKFWADRERYWDAVLSAEEDDQELQFETPDGV